MPSPVSRLGSISEEALRNIVRLLSSAPSKSNWKSFVDGGDALSVLHLDGFISNIARALFTHVRVVVQSGLSDRDQEAGELFLQKSDANFSVLVEWIEAAGKSLKSLSS